jgi:ribonuclease P protein component
MTAHSVWSLFYALKKTESLKNYFQFRDVYNNKRAKADRFFVMFIRENGLDRNRLGISVSKKTGNSVVRHRLTRLIRESYRLHEDGFSSGLDIVISVRGIKNNPQLKDELYCIKRQNVDKSLIYLAKRHHIYKE